MTYNPNTDWDSARQDALGHPVYFLRIDGLTVDYATDRVKNAATTKVILMGLPSGSGVTLDLVDGTRSVQEIEIPLADYQGQITTLVCSEATGAPLPTLINRKAELWGGYSKLDENKYAVIRTGRIGGISKTKDMTTYLLTLTDTSYLLDGQIMTGATDATPATITGNPVNVYWSILTGTFSTSDPTFPLDSVSTATATSSVPTGLGIDPTLIDSARLVSERDLWHSDTVVRPGFPQPEQSARRYLEREFFRAFQCFSPISGAGLIGVKFHVPAIGIGTTLVLDRATNLVRIESWKRRFDLHFNQFRYRGDHLNTGDGATNEYQAQLYTEDTSEDTTDRTNTKETLEFLVESSWMRTDLNGAAHASEIMGRMRGRFLKTPVEIKALVNFTARNIEEGDVVAVNDRNLPNLVTGGVGITGRLMTVTGIDPQFREGLLRLTLLDTNTRRYGLISPGGLTYATATAAQRERYVFVAPLSDSSQPYRWI